MSEKVYFITAKTKGDNPKVVFLNNSTVWRFKSNPALIQTLSDCITYSRQEPTHCLFVEAKASLKEELGDIESPISYTELKQLIQKHDCHTVSTKQKKSKHAKEEPREYLLYYRLVRPITNSSRYHFYLSCGLETTDRHQAYLMTLAEAKAKQQELEKDGEYEWLIEKQPAKTEPLETIQDTPMQPQKRVGYVLYKEGSGGEKIYKCDTNIYAMMGGEAADVFRTEKEANFASYAFNTAYGVNRWKVEQIEF